MSIRTKIAATAGALALIALVPTPAQAQTADAFRVESNRDSYNVSCRAGESFGTAPIRLRVTDDTTGSTQWVATWGGTGSITMTAEDRFFSASRDALFPCPDGQEGSQGSLGQFTITVLSSSGDEETITIDVRRVGTGSGPPAHGPGGAGLVTTVLGIRFGDPNDGPAPIGGVRTGAGGTSQGSNNLLLPIGAGLGFAGLVAAVMIRRRRSPAA
jgi:hypothetical protein